MSLFKKVFDRSRSRERRPEEQGDWVYSAPPGPPPSHVSYTGPGVGSSSTAYQGQNASFDPKTTQEPAPAYEEYAPPPGPPPSHQQAGGTYHDWQSVPDNSLLPPPPAVANDYSPTSNADMTDAVRARQWCSAHPLVSAKRPSKAIEEPSRTLKMPFQGPGHGRGAKVMELRDGIWSGTTKAGSGDLCFTTTVPMYFALGQDSPRLTGLQNTTYFEVHFNRVGSFTQGNAPSLAIGFVAAPYPTWRMPGWERGSFAVHSDDGRRYVNNQDGGVDFVEPFQEGEVVGLGVRYRPEKLGVVMDSALLGEIFFTRNGRLEGTWSLQEETDSENRLGNAGIQGNHDLYGAVGSFGEVQFKVVFR